MFEVNSEKHKIIIEALKDKTINKWEYDFMISILRNQLKLSNKQIKIKNRIIEKMENYNE